MREVDKVRALVRHIRHVQDNAILLGEKLIDQGHAELGRTLIANSMLHDNSKFYGDEWDTLICGDDKAHLKECITEHAHRNKHHPECWGGINHMPDVYLAEMVCDWKARSSEVGTCLVEWIHSVAMPRYGFSPDDSIYKTYETIIRFVELVNEPIGGPDET